MQCDVCGQELMINNVSVVGLSICLPDDSSYVEFKKVKDIFGKTEFNICLTCWLKSLGVKPLETKNDKSL